jgi:hypothetical protein
MILNSIVARTSTECCALYGAFANKHGLYNPLFRGIIDGMRLAVRNGDTENRAWVYELETDGSWICRAAQSSAHTAKHYMQTDRIMIIVEDETDEDEAA